MEGKKTAVLVLGIISLVCNCTGIGGFAGLVCSIIALVFANQITQAEGALEGKAKTGKILAIIALVLSIIAIVVSIICIATGTVASLMGGSY